MGREAAAVLQSLSHVQLFETPWTAAHQASLSFTFSWSLLKLMSLESVMPSSYLILCHPLFYLSSILPIIMVFFSESALRIKWPEYWSFSFSEYSNECSGLVSFRTKSACCPRDPPEFSPASQFKSINSSALSLLYVPTLTSIHNNWKNDSFDYIDLCRQSDVSAF